VSRVAGASSTWVHANAIDVVPFHVTVKSLTAACGRAASVTIIGY
jgi:hypothetical protein